MHLESILQHRIFNIFWKAWARLLCSTSMLCMQTVFHTVGFETFTTGLLITSVTLTWQDSSSYAYGVGKCVAMHLKEG